MTPSERASTREELMDLALEWRSAGPSYSPEADTARAALVSALDALLADAERAKQDTALLDGMEAMALERCCGATSEMVRQDGNLLAADGWRYRWHPYAQGLAVNMTFRRTLREAMRLVLDADAKLRASEGANRVEENSNSRARRPWRCPLR